MPVKTNFVTADYISQVSLPNHGGRYAVIPHGFLIDETRKQLNFHGFKIQHELYKTSVDGQIAQGIYHLEHGADPDMGLMFAWSNSYNKSMRFKCAVGGQVFVCMNGMVSGNLGNYKRKHTGSAKLDAQCSINDQVVQAKYHFDQLVADKEVFKHIQLSTKDMGSVVGELFIDEKILTLTQMGIVQREIVKPSYQYNAHPNSAWSLYNHITLALKDSHPSFYLSDHQKVHNYFVDRFGVLQSSAVQRDELEDEYEEQDAVLEDAFGVNFM